MASRPEHNASHGGASAPVNRCKKENPATSRICNATFKTASALRAREATKHQEMAVITTTFVHHVPGPRRRRSVFRNRAKLQPALITYRSPQRTRARTEESGNAVPASPESLFLPSVVASEGVPDAGLSHTINCPVDDESTPSTPSEGAPDPVPESSDVPGLSQTPGQPHQPQQLPIYECRTSRQHPDQPKALAWATRAGHEHFTSLFTELLARWGLTVQHRGTCLLVPEHLKHSAPLDLMALFDPENFPHAGAPRAWYLYGDHGTTLARAKVWHSWPRTGVELDNFTGRGPYKPMDASHLCHHEHCLIHVVLEPANINQNRKECVRQARFLRAERRTVPEECALHDPPCLMQHAALTSIERYHIQFAVLRQAHGLPANPRIARPRRYVYPTFETQLPCLFPAIEADAAQSVSAHQYIERFCVTAGVKVYASIVSLWSCIVNKHQDVDNAVRLEEIQRTALAWSDYWNLHSEGGKRTNATLTKLEEAQQPGFDWSTVMRWSLRWGQ
ncbi:MAG: hypothetical protein LQ341_001000 [Variospora aurantia]|nr:MAG: hypothetical protein LQ341_001000 [Variospora aurantia]